MKAKGQTDIFSPIWGDYFAGGAGASTGIACAVGEPAYFAVNHSPAALDMYRQNHPHTRLYCEDVFDVDPVEICDGHPVWLLWASPDCTHHSKARGGKPVSKHIRGLPWAIVRAALKVRPGCIMFENVEEIQSWGPCITDEEGNEFPDPERRGETFEGFISIMTKGIEPGHPAHMECCEFLGVSPDSEDGRRLAKGLGYDFEGRELVAADYGAPTIRKRYYGVFRCDGRAIVWPEATHSKTGENGKKKWVAAAEIIDWNLPCPSIFKGKAEIMEQYGLKAVRPLAPNTLKRVISGVDKFTIKSGNPFVVPIGYGEREGQSPRVNSIESPLSTVVSNCKQYLGHPMMTPFAVDVNHGGGFRGQRLEEPMDTITAKLGRGVVQPVVTAFTQTNTTNSVGSDASRPVNTVTSAGNQMLITPSLTAIGQTESKHREYAAEEPVRTVVSKAEQCLIAPVLTQYHDSPEFRGQGVEAPVMTIDGSNRYGLASAQLTEYFGNGQPLDISKPLHTVTSKDREALTLAHVAEFKGQDKGQSADGPLRTITASAGEFAAVQVRVVRYERGTDLGYWPQIRELLNQYCGYTLAEDEVLLLNIGGTWYYISDIGLRMLTPRELYKAMGFPADYCIDFDVNGKPYSKAEKVARCGNAVCPAMSEALVRANFPERCIKQIVSMAMLESLVAV